MLSTVLFKYSMNGAHHSGTIFSSLPEEYITRNHFIRMKTSKSHADWFAHEQCNKMHSLIGECATAIARRETANHSITRMKLSIREKWNLSRSCTLAHSSLLLRHPLNAMICEIYKLFIASSVVFVPMINMLLHLFVTYLHIKPMNVDFFLFCQCIDILFDGMTFIRITHDQHFDLHANQTKSRIQCNQSCCGILVGISNNFDNHLQSTVCRFISAVRSSIWFPKKCLHSQNFTVKNHWKYKCLNKMNQISFIDDCGIVLLCCQLNDV